MQKTDSEAGQSDDRSLAWPRLSMDGRAFVGREPTIKWTRTTDLLITNAFTR